MQATLATAHELWPRVRSVREVWDDATWEGGYVAFVRTVLQSNIYMVDSGVVTFTDVTFEGSGLFHICMFASARADHGSVAEIIEDMFFRFRLDSLHTAVPMNNPRAMRFVEKTGFVPLEQIDDACTIQGMQIDMMLYRMEAPCLG